MKILILGGTGEARELADALVERGHAVTTSLAGRTREPMLPKGELRRGSFGGAAGLANYLRVENFDRLVDATHPYAAMISINAAAAAAETDVPLVRFVRPPWEQQPGANWMTVETVAEAAAALPENAVALLTTGHAGLDVLLERDDCRFVVRLIEPPEDGLPKHAQLVLSRPPHSVEEETEFMARECVTHLVTKNSGGGQTTAKLVAAQKLGVQVIMIARPVNGPAVETSSLMETLRALGLPG